MYRLPPNLERQYQEDMTADRASDILRKLNLAVTKQEAWLLVVDDTAGVLTEQQLIAAGQFAFTVGFDAAAIKRWIVTHWTPCA